ncbi:MAG: hypothetical protein IKY83_05520 [Proteobacteria bacterium]|nr:hypothetical protein [Pseudomonadota bacterium]
MPGSPARRGVIRQAQILALDNRAYVTALDACIACIFKRNGIPGSPSQRQSGP